MRHSWQILFEALLLAANVKAQDRGSFGGAVKPSQQTTTVKKPLTPEQERAAKAAAYKAKLQAQEDLKKSSRQQNRENQAIADAQTRAFCTNRQLILMQQQAIAAQKTQEYVQKQLDEDRQMDRMRIWYAGESAQFASKTTLSVTRLDPLLDLSRNGRRYQPEGCFSSGYFLHGGYSVSASSPQDLAKEWNVSYETILSHLSGQAAVLLSCWSSVASSKAGHGNIHLPVFFFFRSDEATCSSLESSAVDLRCCVSEVISFPLSARMSWRSSPAKHAPLVLLRSLRLPPALLLELEMRGVGIGDHILQPQ